MRNKLFKKGPVFGIIVLLIAITVLPATGTVVNNNIILEGQQIVAEEISAITTQSDEVDWWPMFHHDLENSGYSTADAPDTNNLLWSYKAGDYVYSSPAVVDNKVYFGCGDGKMYCLKTYDGTKLWDFEAGDRVWSSPAVVDDKVYFGSRDGKVYCLDADTGSEIWSYQTPPGGLWPEDNYVDSSPAVVDGKVYIGANNKNVYCFDAETGSIIWNYKTGNWVLSNPAVADGKVYICSDDGHVYCFNADNGNVIWIREVTYPQVWAEDSPTVVDGKVYVIPYGNVLCLDAETGDEIWSCTPTRWELGTVSAGVANGKVYVASWPPYETWGIVFCLDANTGDVIWETNITGNSFGQSSPAIADGKVYIGSIGGSPNYEGEIFCLDADNGSIIWSYTTGWWVMSSPAVVYNRVYIGSSDGHMYCFGSEDVNQPPSVEIVNPKEGYFHFSGIPLFQTPLNLLADTASFGGFRLRPIQVNATDDSYESKLMVTLLINDEDKGYGTWNAKTGYYEWKWTGWALGKYKLIVRAIDPYGAEAFDSMDVWNFCFIP